MSDNEPSILVSDLYKSFKLPHEQPSGIKQLAVNFASRKKGYETQSVLNDISFEIGKGEFFGIVGRNGSGKSTLLKLLAGIYSPDKGHIKVNGTLTPFIELGVGFNPELTGRENVFLNGALLGFSRKEMENIYQEIVDFAELGKFMDQKLKNYSSGMQVRLAFSIAIRAKSDILLFDEVLAVGDAAFQQKCYEMFETMKADGQTIILVTHDMSAVQRFCERAILIDKGKIVLSGNPSLIADRYLEENYSTPKSNLSKENSDTSFTVKNVQTSQNGKVEKSVDIDSDIAFDFDVELSHDKVEYALGFQLFNSDGVYVFGTNSVNAKIDSLSGSSNHVRITINPVLLPATYYLTIAVMDKTAKKVLRYIPKVGSFIVKQQTKKQGIVNLKDDWVINGGES